MVLEMNFFSQCCFAKILKRNRRKLTKLCEVGDLPSGDVLVTVSIKFFGKNGEDQNPGFCAKKNSLFLVSTRNDNISRGCATKMEFPEGRGGGSIL